MTCYYSPSSDVSILTRVSDSKRLCADFFISSRDLFFRPSGVHWVSGPQGLLCMLSVTLPHLNPSTEVHLRESLRPHLPGFAYICNGLNPTPHAWALFAIVVQTSVTFREWPGKLGEDWQESAAHWGYGSFQMAAMPCQGPTPLTHHDAYSTSVHLLLKTSVCSLWPADVMPRITDCPSHPRNDLVNAKLDTDKMG